MLNMEQMQFETKGKGKWYLARQVDCCLDQVSVEQEECAREMEEQKKEQQKVTAQLQKVQEENRRLQELLREKEAESQALRKKLFAVGKTKPEEIRPEMGLEKSIQHQKKVREGLEQERDDLIETIRLLRQLRDHFHAAVRSDAQDLVNQLDTLESKGIL